MCVTSKVAREKFSGEPTAGAGRAKPRAMIGVKFDAAFWPIAGRSGASLLPRRRPAKFRRPGPGSPAGEGHPLLYVTYMSHKDEHKLTRFLNKSLIGKMCAGDFNTPKPVEEGQQFYVDGQQVQVTWSPAQLYRTVHRGDEPHWRDMRPRADECCITEGCIGAPEGS